MTTAGTMPKDTLPVYLRASVPSSSFPKKYKSEAAQQDEPEFTLVFDTETTIDERQALRFGVYQFHKGDELIERGLFHDAEELSAREMKTLQSYAKRYKLRLMTRAEFVDDVFYGMAYELRAAIVGFNLPFDISRLATRHASARGKTMGGGFTFQLSTDPWKPRIQIKHLNGRAALIQFTKPRRRSDTRSMRENRIPDKPRRRAFIDAKTIAAALTSRSFTLGGLAEFLETENQKKSTDEHGDALSAQYIDYAMTDVQATWECYVALRQKFEGHGLTQTRLSQILSEAGLGKTYLREMHIRPFREMQPEFPNDLIGTIMSTYYGGRSEVHLRRTITQILCCDFLSMYPTVCTLMGLWQFVIARGMDWRDSTRETRSFLKRITLSDLRAPETWRNLATIVQVRPDDDLFPVRAKYQNEGQATIGLNYLTGDPQWFTLADCIASKLLNRKAPKIRRAITFTPRRVQDGLWPISILGNRAYGIDPNKDDFYKSAIDMRSEVKSRLKIAKPCDRARLDSEQNAIKILCNATSYGIFVELIVEDLDPPEWRTCFGNGEPFRIKTAKGERPGRYFHPLIATLITGAARLMLAMSEALARDAGLDWAFCDTDSMALAKPEDMTGNEFIKRSRSVCDWFIPLNPYATKGPLFKIEDANYAIRDGDLTDKLQPLFCLAVSAKRYALFNWTADGVAVRKVSAHGLGHLLPPYGADNAPDAIPAPVIDLAPMRVETWHHDLWYKIIDAAIKGKPDQLDLGYHPALDGPAASRYAATTPDILRWFKRHNQGLAYRDQVGPFNFMLAFQAMPVALQASDAFYTSDLSKKGPRKKPPLPKPVAPYDKNILKAALKCFDRETGALVSPQALKTHRQALAQYHVSPESKFLNGEAYDQGPTVRRHVKAASVRNIGKEANRWEEQHFLGPDEDCDVEYGGASEEDEKMFATLRALIPGIGQREISRGAGVSRKTIARVMEGKTVRPSVASRLLNAAVQAPAKQAKRRRSAGG